MLGVFLLPAFTRLGHERQDRLSPCDGMHVSTDKTSIYILVQDSLRGKESEPMLTPRKKSALPEKNSPQRRIEPRTLHQAGQRAQHTTDELFWPPYGADLSRESCLVGHAALCLSVLHGTHINARKYIFIPAMLAGTIDFYHFIPLSLTLALPKDHKLSVKKNLMASFSHTLFN